MQPHLSTADNVAAPQEARVREGSHIRLRALQFAFQTQAQPPEALEGPLGGPADGGSALPRRNEAATQHHLTQEGRRER